ncbi:MgtC/SapB family protein [Pseudoxanthomonas mexicana]|uniref:MgtC/SapB family protein n=1 Tax=Pseudoxanthomonas mexicana TaxID=128785 RepID=UPI00398A76B4
MYEASPDAWLALSSALGLGLLIGLVRERSHGRAHAIAGLRTHALVSLGAAVAAWLGLPVLLVGLGVTGLLAAMAYNATRQDDPGLTSEVTLVVTFLLGAMAMRMPALATGLAVVVAVLLYAKEPLHALTRDTFSEREVFDGLLLLASALVILPILPDRPIGPFDAINLATIWKLVVLVMAISALGHIVLRVVGNRWGLAAAGFFAGYVSSTAAVIGFGQRARQTPALLRSAVAAALLSNLASLSLCVPILWAVSPPLVRQLWPELVAIGAVLLAGGLLGLRAGRHETVQPPTAESRMFRFGHALGFALLVAGLGFVAAALAAWVGPRGALAAAALSATAELHAAVATLAAQFARGGLAIESSRLWMLALLAASLGAKSVIAWVSGGAAYGARVAIGLLGALAAGVMVVWLL